jgi:hypothetical protein
VAAVQAVKYKPIKVQFVLERKARLMMSYLCRVPFQKNATSFGNH